MTLTRSESKGPPLQARSASKGFQAGNRDSGLGARAVDTDSQYADLIAHLTDALALRDASAIESLLAANPNDADRLRKLLPTLEALAAMQSTVGWDKASSETVGPPSSAADMVGPARFASWSHPTSSSPTSASS